MIRQTPSRREQLMLFAVNFFKHPRMLGSLIPSSRFLIDDLMKQIDWERARVIVEYGPGVGTITAEILRRMRPDATLLVLETNSDFVKFLQKGMRDPRLHVVHGSAADVVGELARLGKNHADYVISGIPFSTMPAEVRDVIIRNTRSALEPNGKFLVYQFSREVHPYLKRTFRRVQQGFQPFNIPPAQLYFCTP
ncbi:MAG: methyltransferase [Gemmatimonadota bacterium]|nr:methyltransferase [Gemmatimonadota bacterium]